MWKPYSAANSLSLPSLSSDLPRPLVMISESMGSNIAGQEYQLLCTVEVVEGLTFPPDVMWLDRNNVPINQQDIAVGEPENIGNISTLTLTFNPLRTSHAEQYTCQANVIISEVAINVNNNDMFSVNVQSTLCLTFQFLLYKVSLIPTRILARVIPKFPLILETFE